MISQPRIWQNNLRKVLSTRLVKDLFIVLRKVLSTCLAKGFIYMSCEMSVHLSCERSVHCLAKGLIYMSCERFYLHVSLQFIFEFK